MRLCGVMQAVSGFFALRVAPTFWFWAMGQISCASVFSSAHRRSMPHSSVPMAQWGSRSTHARQWVAAWRCALHCALAVPCSSAAELAGGSEVVASRDPPATATAVLWRARTTMTYRLSVNPGDRFVPVPLIQDAPPGCVGSEEAN